MLYMSHEEVDVRWRESFAASSGHSRYFLMLLIYHLLNVIAVMALLKTFRNNEEVTRHILVLLPALGAILGLAGYYYVGMRRFVRNELMKADEDKVKSALWLSYIGYRLYLACLGVSSVILLSVPIIIRSQW